MRRTLRLPTKATAYHEAGHAVVAHVLGQGIKRITVVPNKSQNYVGCVFFAKQPSVKGIDRDPSSKITRAAQERIMVSLAGLCAQRLFNPRTCRSFHGDEDFKEVLLYVGHLVRENEAKPFLNWMEVTCLDFLIHVEVRISTFRRTRWACDSPDCCGVARCYIPPANARSSPWHRLGYETSWRSNTHPATAH